MMRAAAFVVALFVIAVACSTPRELEVKTGPSTPYPCGVFGVSCAMHMCCASGEDCGGDPNIPGCPAGECCASGEDTFGSKRDGGAPRRTHHQTPAQH